MGILNTLVKMILVKISYSITTLSLLLSLDLIQAAPQGSLITYLPGFDGTFPSRHYSGYVTIDGNPGEKNLFYYFIESERSPSSDPVVLWLNGGPGCSSFDGFIYEHGPFNFVEGNSKGSLPTLHLNPYSWSKVSNIIYLDSPCGVGLSYSDNPGNYKTGDLQTASDTHAFLLKWFGTYPEFLQNPFYISGESYAGIYAPTLAMEVAKGIKLGQKPLVNLKGYMVGNGLADDKFDGNGYIPFIFGMGLISNDIYKACESTCGGKYYDPPNEKCQQSLTKAFQALKGLNSYAILEPCYHHPETETVMINKSIPFRKRIFSYHLSSAGEGQLSSSSESDNIFHIPCIDDRVAVAWMNDETVRKAIHAKPASVAGIWSICAPRVRANYTSDTGSMIPYHKNLTSEGYRALIYSGDHDSAVPYTGTQTWIRSLGYKITDEWRSWICDEQVAGYLQGYDKNLTFLTIKGAGHMVPQYKPRESLQFFSRWLEGKQI